jgi:class 3 adenylate cyclase/CheY-like chemotaxis protein
MKCKKCGQENPSEALFCMKCGARFEGRCPRCGADYPEEALFCMKCGAKLMEFAFVQAEPRPAEGKAPLVGAQHAGLMGEIPHTPGRTQDEGVPKLEDMQDQLYIPEPLKQRMDAAKEDMNGENRLVTALFADISGFTPMSQELVPEAVVERVNKCFQVITDVVYHYEGSINQFIGDGVLAFFGAPLTHENDPERAILAALDIRDAVSQLGLNVSVGINTGMTYFGTIGTQQHQEISAYGHNVNLAKRLQEAAKPGQIFVGAGTYRLTRGALNFSPLDTVMLKGIRLPVHTYEVLSVKEHPEKLRGIEGLRARMIGREHEFVELKEATDAWLHGQGQIVSIIGEAGIGKSRLVGELREYIDSWFRTQDTGDEEGEKGRKGERGKGGALPSSLPLFSLSPRLSFPSPLCLEGRCVSIGQPISYWPFRDIVRIYFGLSEEDGSPTIARKLTEVMERLFADYARDILPFLGHLFSIRFGNELDETLRFATPEQIRHQMLTRLQTFFEILASKQPLLLILDDLHWADDLSLDLISLLMDTLTTAPLMLLCVYRPEREHRVWQLSSLAQRKCLDRYREITLKPLSGPESRQLVETLLTIDSLPESVKDMILRKSEGNPFFIEEVIRSLIEGGLVYREDGRWKAHDQVADIDVPDTIQSVVLARVDRLQADAKYVLQCASVIGRLFSHRLLEHLTQQDRNLDRYLSELTGRELIYEERSVPELEYAFRHALTQEATYQSILESRRRKFHHKVAQGIEILYWERLEEYYEELAHHYSRSDDTSKAVEYLLKAGEKAKRSYANDAAISYFQKALEMQGQRGPGPHNILIVDDEVSNLNALERAFRDDYNVFSVTNGKDALAIMEEKDMALIIADHRMPGMTGVEFLEKASQEYPDTTRILLTAYTDEKLLMDAINMGHVHSYITKPWELDEIRSIVAEHLDDALRVQNAEKGRTIGRNGIIVRNDWKLEALRGLGEVYLGTGRTVEAEGAFEEAIALAKEMELPPRHLVRLYHWISEALWWQGRYNEVIDYGEMGLEILGDDTECLEAALMNSAIAMGDLNKGNTEKWREYTRKNMAFIKKLPYSVELRPPYGHIVDVVALEDGDVESALEWAKELEARSVQHNDLRGMASVWLHKGDVLVSKGDYKNSLSLLQKSLETYERIGDARFAGWCYGHIGEALLYSGNVEEAETHALTFLSMTEQVGNPRDIAQAHWLSGKVAMCQHRWEEAISHFQKFLEGYRSIGARFWVTLAHLCLGVVYLKKCDYGQALQSLEAAADIAVETQRASWLCSALGGLEEAYIALGTPEKFAAFCHSFKEQHADVLERLPLRQWYLEPAELSEEFSHLAFADDFDNEAIDPSWSWIDEFGDCAYRIAESGGLEISAANGRDLYGLNLSAPRFMREISGDFAVEVRMSPASDFVSDEKNRKPQIGGLLVWKDGDNFLRFEKGVHGRHEVRLRWPVAGRGLLSGEEVYLRLERAGEQFSAYCSVDGENWLSCGKLALQMDDPIQVGICTIGRIDRTIYCGSFKDGTATLFRGFRAWTR